MNLRFESPYSSSVRPVLRGRIGAVSAAHPYAVAAGQEILTAGGSAADACIAGQAVICVIAPDACGVGGDMFALIHRRGEEPVAINAAGAAPAGLIAAAQDGGASVTVPGLVEGWGRLAERWGRLPLSRSLAPAIRIAREGAPLAGDVALAAKAQRARLDRGGAGGWNLLGLEAGEHFEQPELADLLEAIGRDGPSAFYEGAMAEAIARAVVADGGVLSAQDLAGHRGVILAPLITRHQGCLLATQPPMAQGILLNMAMTGMDRLGMVPPDRLDHARIELTEAAFLQRARVGEGLGLLDIPLPVDLDRAARRGGPRAYLHTAGVAVADRDGLTIVSLISLFDYFGSCVFVPEGGFTLNNRAGGFTEGPNAAAPGKLPVHTLAPAMLMSGETVIGLATPGADGQIQTLLQIVGGLLDEGIGLAEAVARPRWRSENGTLLIETSHPAREGLEALGHQLKPLPDGDMRFGGVVCAGQGAEGPVALADWRRETWAGAL